MINRFLTSELVDKDNANVLKSNISQLANSYYSNFKPSLSSPKKHGILKKLKMNNDIVIIKPD